MSTLMDVKITQVESFQGEENGVESDDEGLQEWDSDVGDARDSAESDGEDDKQPLEDETRDDDSNSKETESDRKRIKKVQPYHGKSDNDKEKCVELNAAMFTTLNQKQTTCDIKDQNNWTYIDNDTTDEEKSKSSSKIGMRIRSAASYMKRKLSRKKKDNSVKEISLKPEAERNKCWSSDVTPLGGDGKDADDDSSRSNSAGSFKGKGANIQVEEVTEDDGIEVIYDVEYNGGGV